MRKRLAVAAALTAAIMALGTQAASAAPRDGSYGEQPERQPGDAGRTQRLPVEELACGDVLTSSVEMASDLDCSGEEIGLRVAGDWVTLDLGGYHLTGDDGFGILIDSSHATVRNGTVSGFRNGAWFGGGSSESTVRDVTINFTKQAVTMKGVANSVDSIDVSFAPQAGIWVVAGHDHVISNSNVYRANWGVLVQEHSNGSPADRPRDLLIQGNHTSLSHYVGVWLDDGDGSIVSGNTFDVEETGVSVSADGVSVVGNVFNANGFHHAIRVSGADALVRENVVQHSKRGILGMATAIGLRIEDNVIHNTNRAILIEADGAQVLWNTITESSDGIELIGDGNTAAFNHVTKSTRGIVVAPGAVSNSLLDNSAHQSAFQGIFDQGSGTTIQGNAAHDNGSTQSQGTQGDFGLGIQGGSNVTGSGNIATGNANPDQCSPQWLCA